MTTKGVAVTATAVLFLALMACLPAPDHVVTPAVTRGASTPIMSAATPTEVAILRPTTPAGTLSPKEPLPEVALSAEEIMKRSAETMSGVATAHIIFAQEQVGEYTASGEGVVALPDRAHIVKISSYDEEAVDMIVIGATGYWVDESVSGGWNLGPIAPFASNPARWVELAQFYSSPALLGQDKVNGVDCYHLEFPVDLEPGWLGLFSGGGTGEAWISEADLSLIKATYDLEYEGARESGRMLLTLELSELNEPVTIEAPR